MGSKKPKKKKTLFAKIFDPRMWLFDFVKVTGCIPVLIDLRLKKIYENGSKPKGLYKGDYLVSANHVSYIDPIILDAVFASRRLGFVATREIFEIPFWGKFFKAVGCIEVNRDNVSMQTFKLIANRIQSGHLVGVFPEGHVSADGDLKAFKSGIVMMAIMSNADILPTYIVKRENRWKRQVVVIGNKIKVSDYITSAIPSIAEIDHLAQVIHDKEKELEELYNQKNK